MHMILLDFSRSPSQARLPLAGSAMYMFSTVAVIAYSAVSVVKGISAVE